MCVASLLRIAGTGPSSNCFVFDPSNFPVALEKKINLAADRNRGWCDAANNLRPN